MTERILKETEVDGFKYQLVRVAEGNKVSWQITNTRIFDGISGPAFEYAKKKTALEEWERVLEGKITNQEKEYKMKLVELDELTDVIANTSGVHGVEVNEDNLTFAFNYLNNHYEVKMK